MKEECITCINRNKYFSSGCAVDEADPTSIGDCAFHEEDFRCCPTCKNVFADSDMVWVRDDFGIPYKKVCQTCVDKTRAELVPYPIFEADVNY